MKKSSGKYGIHIKWIKGMEPPEDEFWYDTKKDREKAYRICYADNKIVSVNRISR